MRTYTEAEVQAMIAEQIALLKSKGSKSTKFVVKVGEFDTKDGVKAYQGIEIQGNFKPRYVSLSVAKAIVADVEGFRATVLEAEKPQAPKVDPTAPRIAAKA